MNNPVAKLQRTAEEYRKLDSKDKRRFWSDGLLNNALYILMVISSTPQSRTATS